MAVLGSIQPQPLEHQVDGTIALADIEGAIKPDDPHFARTRLIALENTTGGKVLPVSYMRQVRQLANRHGLSTHIDGARLFNAAVALAGQNGTEPVQQAREICLGYDSVSLCLSKGLGAPVGSLLLGSSSFVARARRVRKMLGGGMRQAGMLAAAGIYALQNHVHRLAEDHDNAGMLSEGLSQLGTSHPRLRGKIIMHAPQTNIVFMDMETETATDFVRHLTRHEIKITSAYQRSGNQALTRIRWVTHLDVGRADVERALCVAESF